MSHHRNQPRESLQSVRARGGAGSEQWVGVVVAPQADPLLEGRLQLSLLPPPPGAGSHRRSSVNPHLCLARAHCLLLATATLYLFRCPSQAADHPMLHGSGRLRLSHSQVFPSDKNDILSTDDLGCCRNNSSYEEHSFTRNTTFMLQIHEC